MNRVGKLCYFTDTIEKRAKPDFGIVTIEESSDYGWGCSDALRIDYFNFNSMQNDWFYTAEIVEETEDMIVWDIK